MKSFAVFALVGLAAVGFAQEQPVKTGITAKKHAGAVGGGPVTGREASMALDRAERALIKALHVTKVGTSLVHADDKPVSRQALVLEFKRIFDEARPRFEFIPTKTKVVESAIKFANPKARAAAETLISFKCISKVGALIAGPADTIMVPDLGDDLGLLLARIAELCHLPSTKFSPTQMPPGGG